MRLAGQHVTCRRGGREVFAGLDFEAPAGTALAVRGPNGAGKSSLLRLVAGLVRPAAGTLTLEGGDPERPIAEQAHYVGHLDAIKPALSVRDNLAFWRSFQGDAAAPPEAALARLGIGALSEFPAAVLSAGQRRRLALARLLASRRPIWLLDEPTTALDAQGRDLLDSLIVEHLAGGGLALVATHVDFAAASITLELGAAR